MGRPDVIPGDEAVCATASADPIPPIPRRVEAVLNAVLIFSVVGEMVVIFADVMARTLFHSSLLWGEEIAHLALTVVAFVGGAVAYPRGQHMAVHALIARLPAAWRRAIAALVDWLVLWLSLATAAVQFTLLPMAIRLGGGVGAAYATLLAWFFGALVAPLLFRKTRWFVLAFPRAILFPFRA